MVKKRTRPRTIIRLRRLDNRKIKRIASIIVMGWLCWILYKGILQTRDNRRQAYFHQILDSVVKGTIPKGPIRFLYYDNILTQCDCPYLPQGVIDPTYYAAILSSYGENNHSNRPWEAIYAMPGISHARTNLACLLEEASLLGAIAVLPAVCLSPIHNHDRLIRTHWSRYLYMERLEQGFPIVWNVSLLEKKLQDSFQVYASWPYPLRWNCVLSINYTFTMDDGKNIRKSPEQIFASNHEKYPSTAIFSEKTPTLLLQQSKANILIRQFHTNQEYMACSSFSSWNHPKIQNVWSYFWSSAETDPLPAVQYIRSLYDASESFLCLHLRRGDKLKESRYPCLDVLTRGPHIYSVLQNASVPCEMKIYVLSNENETQLDHLLLDWNRKDNRYSCDYRWIYRQHIPYLQQSKYIQDNYLLYETEKRICSYAVGYVETHRTHSSYQHLQPWNLRLTPYEEECDSTNCHLNCAEYSR